MNDNDQSFVLWLAGLAITAYVAYWVIRAAITHALREDRRARRAEEDRSSG